MKRSLRKLMTKNENKMTTTFDRDVVAFIKTKQETN